MNRETQGREGEDDVKKYGVVGVVPWWGIPVDVKRHYHEWIDCGKISKKEDTIMKRFARFMRYCFACS